MVVKIHSNSNPPRCICLAGLIILFLTVNILSANDNNPIRRFVVPSQAKEVGKSGIILKVFFKRLVASNIAKPGDLKFRVKASLKMEKHEQILDTLKIKPEALKLTRDIDLTDYDELWLDYSALNPNQHIGLDVNLSVAAYDYNSQKTMLAMAAAGEVPLKPVLVIDSGNAVWIEKNYEYSLGRILKFKPDEKWRYQSFGDLTIIQSRLHQDLSCIEALDVELSPDTEVKNINLRIGTGDNYSPGEMIELGVIEPLNSGSTDNSIYRINIPRLLAEHFPGKKQAYVQEVIVFVKGNAPDIAASRPLKALVFQEKEAGSYKTPLRSDEQHAIAAPSVVVALPSSTEKVSSDTERLVVDLRSLGKWQNAFLKSANITTNDQSADGVRLIKKIRLVSLQEKDSPVFLRAGQALIRSWGGPFVNDPDPAAGVEWPAVSAYIQFKKFIPDHHKPVYARNSLTAAGSTLRSDKPFKVEPGSGVPVVKGFGAKLVLDLPVNAAVSAGSVFFLAANYGLGQVRNSILSVKYANGSMVNFTVTPNIPVRIPAKGLVKGLTLTITAAKTPFLISLKEAVLFHPVVLTTTEAFNTRIPVDGTMLSAAEELRDWPILLAGNQPVKFVRAKYDFNRVLFGPIWINAGPNAVSELIVSSGSITPIVSKWFNLDSAVIEPVAALPQGAWDKLVAPPPGTPLSLRLLKLGLLFATLHFIWKKRAVLLLAPYYRLLPVFNKIVPVAQQTPKHVAAFWGIVTLALYVAGLIKHSGPGENYYLTFGGMAATFFMRFALELFRPILRKISPAMDETVFSDKAKPYFACGILGLAGTAILLVFKLPPVAEQLAIIVYYCLVIGVILEGIALYKSPSGNTGYENE